MTVVLPAALSAAAVAVALGLPAPRRLPGGRGDARSSVPVARLLTLLPVAAALLALPLLGPVAALLAGAAALGGRHVLGLRAARSRREAERRSSAEALAVLGGELRAGRCPEDALERAGLVAVGPLRQALCGAASAARVGGAAAEVLQRAAASSAVPELLRGLGACWQVCQGTGSSLAAAVDRLELALHEERVRRDAVDAELAGPRATAALLSVLPGLGTLMSGALGARPVHVLLHTLLGGVCLAVGLGLDLAGVWWTGRIVRRAGGAR